MMREDKPIAELELILCLREVERAVFMEATRRFPWLLRKCHRDPLFRFCSLAAQLGVVGGLQPAEQAEFENLMIELHMGQAQRAQCQIIH